MTKRNTGAYEVIMALAKRPNGVGQDDDGVIARNIYKMHGLGRLFTIKTGIGNEKKRYFDSQERADAFYKDRKPSKKTHPKSAKPKPKALVGEYPTVRIAAKGGVGPARLPGEPVITKRTKITIAPPPPAVLYRTGTHNYH